MKKTAETDHPVHELVAERWSPRAIGPGPVAPETLRSLFEAARWAPSCFNEQPWSYVVARREDEEAFAQALSCLTEGNQVWAKDAAVLAFGLTRRTYSRNDKPNRHAGHDLGLATASLTMQATAAGLFVHQMAGIHGDRIRELFGVPDAVDVMTGIAIGPAGDPANLPEEVRQRESTPRTRKAQDDFVFGARFGEPAAW